MEGSRARAKQKYCPWGGGERKGRPHSGDAGALRRLTVHGIFLYRRLVVQLVARMMCRWRTSYRASCAISLLHLRSRVGEDGLIQVFPSFSLGEGGAGAEALCLIR